MFLNTLSLGEIAVKKWARKKVETLPKTPKELKQSDVNELHKFLDALPKLESHYCRASTSKLYLETMWHSKSQLYKFYCQDFCTENKIKPLSRATFSVTFDKKNLHYISQKRIGVIHALRSKQEIFHKKNTTTIFY